MKLSASQPIFWSLSYYKKRHLPPTKKIVAFIVQVISPQVMNSLQIHPIKPILWPKIMLNKTRISNVMLTLTFGSSLSLFFSSIGILMIITITSPANWSNAVLDIQGEILVEANLTIVLVGWIQTDTRTAKIHIRIQRPCSTSSDRRRSNNYIFSTFFNIFCWNTNRPK